MPPGMIPAPTEGSAHKRREVAYDISTCAYGIVLVGSLEGSEENWEEPCNECTVTR